MHLEPANPDATAPPGSFDAEASLRRNLRVGTMLVAVLVFGLGALAATLPMASAVVAPGEVSVESNVKRVGHPTGGVIAGLYVRNGDHVARNQLLLRLDSTIAGADATLADENLDQLLAREARLTAERDAAPTIVFPLALTRRSPVPQVAALLREEQGTFRRRRAARSSQSALLVQRIRQAEAEIAGHEAQAAAIQEQSGFIAEELTATRTLWEKRFTTLQRLNQLERAAVALRGDAATAQTGAAQARAKITEIREQLILLEQDARSQAATELGDVQSRLAELRQRKVAADDANARTVVRSPEAGIVDKLAYTTVGGVVPAGETILEIVPDAGRLIVTAHIRITDIDQVVPGRPAALRFSAFNQRTTPEIEGRVDRVSADRSVDPRTGVAQYVAQIVIPGAEMKRLGGLKLKPGMPVEAFIRTGERTMLGYILKPLGDQVQRAFVEE